MYCRTSSYALDSPTVENNKKAIYKNCNGELSSHGTVRGKLLSSCSSVPRCALCCLASLLCLLLAAAVTILSSTRSPDGKCAVLKQQVADKVGLTAQHSSNPGCSTLCA